MDAGQFDKVIPVLQQIIRDYKFLGWDGRAAPLLGKAQLEAGQAADALKTFDGVLSDNPSAGESDGFKAQYWKALIANDKGSKVLPLLNKSIESGSRELAAQAQLMRGDLNAGNSRYEDALLDYLRTVTLFKKVSEVQPEALLKVAETLETLKDVRAKKFYQKVIDEYPGTAQAQNAQSKL
jgi:TolA-binding protein